MFLSPSRNCRGLLRGRNERYYNNSALPLAKRGAVLQPTGVLARAAGQELYSMRSFRPLTIPGNSSMEKETMKNFYGLHCYCPC